MAKKSKAVKPKSRKSAMGTAASRHAISEKFRKQERKEEKKKPHQVTAKPFAPGNDFWNKRSKHGKDRIFADPQSMYEAMVEYFEDNKKDVERWAKHEWKTVNGKLKLVKILQHTPMTWEGLAMFCGVTSSYFRAFKSTLKQDDPHRQDFITVIEWAGEVIFRQKFEGSASNHFNPQLMSYHLGIRKDMPQSTAAGVVINVSENKNKDLINDVINQLNELDKEDK
jgi:hypothetical protein